MDSLAPDLVIADIHMPGATGYEVARRVKQSARHRSPVLLLVGTFEPFVEADVDASGADGFLMKPFDSQELLSRVEELFGSYRVQIALWQVAAPADGETEPADPEPSGASQSPRRGVAGERASPSRLRSSLKSPIRQTDPSVPSFEPTVRRRRRWACRRRTSIRIARLVVVAAITPEIVREVAREVVPQVAELVVKERIRQSSNRKSTSRPRPSWRAAVRGDPSAAAGSSCAAFFES